MTQYNVEAIITEHFFVDADSMEEAYAIAEQQIVEGFDVMPSQVSVNYAKELI